MICLNFFFFFFKQKTAYEMDGRLEFRRVLFRSPRTSRGRAPPRTDVAQGLEVSLRNILQDLFVQCQLRDQPLQLAILPLQFLQSLRLVHLQPAVLLPPAVERLHCDLRFLAGLWGGFSVRDAYFDLPQHRHDLLCFVPLDRHDQLFLQVDSLSFHLVQKSPVTSLCAWTKVKAWQVRGRRQQPCPRLTRTQTEGARRLCKASRGGRGGCSFL